MRDVLKPGGAMQLMVYASYGRTGIYMLQEYCRLVGVRPNDRDLEDLSGVLSGLPTGHPLAHLLEQAKDFRSPPALADALLHPQDRSYTVPQLHEWLEQSGCAFAGWLMQAPYLPYCGIVRQSPHARRLAQLPAQEQHAALELIRGTMVTHEFVAIRNDSPALDKKISFTGQSPLSYVPIRIPTAVTVTERLPAGAAAVLLNPSHRHTDIVLPINAIEKQWLDKIDGSRTVREIVGSDNQERGVEFMQNLWRHDQVVVDASGR